MPEDSMKTKDEVTVVLYDKEGKIKATTNKPPSKLEKILKILFKVLERW